MNFLSARRLIVACALVGMFSFGIITTSKIVSASSDRPFGGTVAEIGPAIAITIDKEICQAMNVTTGFVNISPQWDGDTDEGNDQTFTLMPNYSPSPSPDTYLIPNDVQPKTSEGAEQNKKILGLYQTEYKKVGTCTLTITVIGVSVDVDIPFYLNLGKVTMYGVNAG
jgi:hypothetical protein